MKKERIDSHQHFWNYNPARHHWMTEEMGALKTNFLPIDLLPYLQRCSLEGCVAVQADQSEAENTFLLAQAAQHDFIRGVVGWVDLQSEQVEERFAFYQQFPKLKGFRHVLQGEAQRDFMMRPAFLRGISKLKDFNYTYDILIFTDQLAYTLEFVKLFPAQPFVIDHIAKPFIKQQMISEWKDYITKIAVYENVYCKISGLVTEADWQYWKPADFKPYLDVVVETFGMNRVMYGSDWPVCTLAGSYEEVYGIVTGYFSAFSESEQDRFFGGNANRFYRL